MDVKSSESVAVGFKTGNDILIVSFELYKANFCIMQVLNLVSI